MSTLSIIGTILFWGVVGLIYYYSEMRPHQAEGFFQNMRRVYSQVLNGERSFYTFIRDYYLKCQKADPKDTPGLIDLKSRLLIILPHEDFVKEKLAEPNMTLYRFLEAWTHYEPPVESEDITTTIPDIFTKGKGKEILDLMVSKGYCEPETLKWNPEKSTYLMALFATAIAQELNLTKNSRKPFNEIWGNNGKDRNISDLETQALGSKKSDDLISEVKELFPNYSPKKY